MCGFLAKFCHALAALSFASLPDCKFAFSHAICNANNALATVA